MALPILYSYRRCPYAMRARMALKLANVYVEIREISLREKPAHMLQVSPKGTVPVLVLPDGKVIDESLEIMQWALKTHALQPQGLSSQNIPAKAGYSCVNANIHAGAGASVLALIAENDGEFKPALDAYKYPERYPHKTQIQYRADGEVFLQKLENLLQKNQYLFGDTFSMADIAIFPFVRQFAAVDAAWFDDSPYSKLKDWQKILVDSQLFVSIMEKRPTHINM